MRQQKRIQGRQGLLLNEQSLQILVETIPALVWRAKPNGHIDYVNKRLLEYFGSPLEEIIGWGWMQKAHPDDVAFKVQSWLRNLEVMASHDVNCRFQGADGAYRWFNVRGEPLRDGDGSVQNWYGVFIDIDNQKKAEEKSRESEAQLTEAKRELRQLIDTIQTPVASYSADNRRYFVNAAWKQYTGLSDEAALGTEWSVVTHPDHTASGEKMWRDALATGEPWHTEERVRRADGQYRWFAINRVAARDENGKIIKWYATGYDIEDRKRAEEALLKSERSAARSAIDGIAGLVAILAPNGEVETVNRQVFEYFGRSLERLHRASPPRWRRSRGLPGGRLRSTGGGRPSPRLGCWHVNRRNQFRNHCRQYSRRARRKTTRVLGAGQPLSLRFRH
jgi:PAS domain S-box-containing protein